MSLPKNKKVSEYTQEELNVYCPILFKKSGKPATRGPCKNWAGGKYLPIPKNDLQGALNNLEHGRNTKPTQNVELSEIDWYSESLDSVLKSNGFAEVEIEGLSDIDEPFNTLPNILEDKGLPSVEVFNAVVEDTYNPEDETQVWSTEKSVESAEVDFKGEKYLIVRNTSLSLKHYKSEEGTNFSEGKGFESGLRVYKKLNNGKEVKEIRTDYCDDVVNEAKYFLDTEGPEREDYGNYRDYMNALSEYIIPFYQGNFNQKEIDYIADEFREYCVRRNWCSQQDWDDFYSGKMK